MHGQRQNSGKWCKNLLLNHAMLYGFGKRGTGKRCSLGFGFYLVGNDGASRISVMEIQICN